MMVRVELKPAAFSDKLSDLMKLKRNAEYALKNSLNVAAEVELLEPGSLARFEGKAKRVVDNRRD